MNHDADHSLAAYRQGRVQPPSNGMIRRKTDRLRASYILAGPLLDALRLLGSEIVYADQSINVREAGRAGYGTIRFSAAIENLFGFTREVFILFSPYDDLQYRTFQAIPHMMRKLPREPSPQVALLSSPDPRIAEKLDDWNTQDPLVVPCPPVTIGDQKAALEVIRTLRRRIYLRNMYEATSPVEDAEFFGRKLLLQAVEEGAKSRRPGVILGLRKAGKTSLLKEVGRRLEEKRSAIFTLRDLESLPSPPSPLVPELIADLTDDLRERLPRSASRCLVDVDETASIASWRRSVKKALTTLPSDQLVVLALDEMEYLCPPDMLDTLTPETEAITQFLGALRSLVQETPNFVFLMSGMTPAPVERGMLFGRHNPLFSWATAYYVRPFDLDDTHEMIVSLGRRMGLEWRNSSVERVYRASGGHVFLMRRLAASLANKVPIDATRRLVIPALVDDTVPTWRRDIEPNVAESMQHVKRYYPSEWAILKRLRELGSPVRSQNAAVSSRFRNLEQLGLATFDGSTCRLVEFLT